MVLTIINDCADANAIGRQCTRIQGLFSVSPVFIPIAGTLDDASQLEASGNVVDTLDAASDHDGLILVNVAPRSGADKKWGNGTPFGYFDVGNVRVITALSGLTLALPQKLGIVNKVQVFDLEATVLRMHVAGTITDLERDNIPSTQFRSLNFLPYVAHFLHGGGHAVTEEVSLEPTDLRPRIWTIDNFGNMKTTLTGRDIAEQTHLETQWGDFPIVPSLKDVPDGWIAVTIGSSGYRDTRFVEIVEQGGNAAKTLAARPGSELFTRL